MIGRRIFLAGMAATVAAPPLRAASDPDAALRATLDGLATLDSPSAKLARLQEIGTRGLSPGALLDLEAAREGLAIDARIAAIMPHGRLGRSPYTVTPTSGLERAQVKWFNRLRGFGFLTCGEGTPDIFVHMETLRRYGMTELRPGQYVLVRFGPGSKGMMAAEIQPETGAPGLSSH